MSASPVAIARACEEVCARLGLSEDVEAVIALAVETVCRPAREPGLTRQETSLVEALRKGRGRVLSHEYLHSAMGSRGSDAKNLVRTRVVAIKRKRADLARRIQNVWGEGYRWGSEA